MYDTMIEFDGVGLAAPQVGVDEQIAIVILMRHQEPLK